MMDALKVIILGIVQGITEWLPISSTGHLILLDSIMPLQQGNDFFKMFEVVIQLGAILAVVVIYFHKLNPFSPRKTKKQKLFTIQIWIKVLIGSIPAGIVGVLFNDFIEAKLGSELVIAATLIIYGVLFIVVENYQKGRKPRVTEMSQLTVPMILFIGVFQMLALIPGTSRSGATIIGGILLGTSRELAAEYTFFLAIPVMFGASLLKILSHGFSFTGVEVGMLVLGMAVAFVVSVFAIKFLMKYIKKHDFKVFGYYRIVLGGLIIVVALIQLALG